MLVATVTKGPSPSAVSAIVVQCKLTLVKLQLQVGLWASELQEGKQKAKSRINNARLSLSLVKKGTKATGHVILSIIRSRFATPTPLGHFSLSTAFQGG